MLNVPQYTALLHCTGNVPNTLIPVHIPVPVSAGLSHVPLVTLKAHVCLLLTLAFVTLESTGTASCPATGSCNTQAS